MKVKSQAPDGYKTWAECLKAEVPLLFAELCDEHGVLRAGINARRVIQKSLENGEDLFEHLTINGLPLPYRHGYDSADTQALIALIRAMEGIDIVEIDKTAIIRRFQLAKEMPQRINEFVKCLKDRLDNSSVDEADTLLTQMCRFI